MEDPLPYIYLAVLVLLSGIFSGAEIALISLTPAKLRTLLENKRPGAAFVQRLKKNSHKTLITILIGNNVVNVAASALATIVAEKAFGSAGLSIAIGIMTLLILIFGEIMPKTIAQKYNTTISLFLALPLYILSIILTPIIWFFMGLNRLIPHSKNIEHLATEEELRAMVEITQEAGQITEHESEYIKNIFEFNDTTAEEIMTSRTDIETISIDTTIKEALDFISKSPHSRIPVYQESIDNIIGILTLKDLVKLAGKGRTGTRKLKSVKLIKPLFVPMSSPISTLFKEFQKKHVHMAIVLDEHAGTEGIVTMEDILEEIMGDIMDESDKEASGIKKLSERMFLINGDTTVEEIHEYGIPLVTKVQVHKTISFLILQKLGRFPGTKEKIRVGKNLLIIEKMGENIIEKVKFIIPKRVSKDG